MSKNSNPNVPPSGHPSRGDIIRADIILSVTVIAFFLMLLMCCWGCISPGNAPTRRRRYYDNLMTGGRTRRRRTNRVLNVDPTNQNPAPITVTGGLDASVLKSIPVFTYSTKTHPNSSLECAVCLSEFEENESGRVLPKCNHTFHVQCIDMWFGSHSTCPNCREPVKPAPTQPKIPAAVVLTITEPGSSSVLCQHEEEQVVKQMPSISSIEEFEDESTRCDSPASQSFKSSMSRMLSFTSCGGPVTELDIERGKDEAKQTQG